MQARNVRVISDSSDIIRSSSTQQTHCTHTHTQHSHAIRGNLQTHVTARTHRDRTSQTVAVKLGREQRRQAPCVVNLPIEVATPQCVCVCVSVMAFPS